VVFTKNIRHSPAPCVPSNTTSPQHLHRPAPSSTRRGFPGPDAEGCICHLASVARDPRASLWTPSPVMHTEAPRAAWYPLLHTRRHWIVAPNATMPPCPRPCLNPEGMSPSTSYETDKLPSSRVLHCRRSHMPPVTRHWRPQAELHLPGANSTA
jgi:hypothetical protein